MMHQKYKIPLAAVSLGLVSTILFSYLTFIQNQTFAAEETRTLADIHYMQEMNVNVCKNTREEDKEKQYQLIDIRDNKTYYVAKLADEQCWMTQNLDFDLDTVTASNPLTPDNSNVTSTITDTKTTKTPTPKDWSSTDNNTANYYYDPGEYVYNTTDGKYKDANDCANIQDNFDNSKCENYFTRITDSNKNTVDMHYHVGNYYSWRAATVQQNNGSTSTKPETSICPKGWKLPTSNSTSEIGSFGYMLTRYGLQSNLSGNNSVTIYGKPFYFVYSGYTFNSSSDYAGRNGYYWSSTPDGTSGAYDLYFDISSVNSSDASNRSTGSSVRCVNNPLVTTSENLSQPEIPPAHGTANISVTVSPVISLDVATSSTSDKMTAEFTKVSTSEIITNVSSNYQYTVSISTEQTTLEQDPKTEYNIPMIGTGTNGNGKDNVEKNVSGWGIKKKLSATNPEELGSTKDEDKYSPVGIGSAHPEVFYKSNGAEALTNDKALVFEVGVGVDTKLPSGIYFTTVTLTANVI